MTNSTEHPIGFDGCNRVSLFKATGVNKQQVESQITFEVEAITFDDFLTLRYPIKEKEDIIYPILTALKKQGLGIKDEQFLTQYFTADKAYRQNLQKTLRESSLDDIIHNTLAACKYEPPTIQSVVRQAVNYGLETRRARWFPSSKKTLLALRKKGYKLGLISNTHWRISERSKKEFKKFLDVTTLSYEHGYAKPHPSIFISTLEKLETEASRCLHVGDDPVADIQGAKNAGMKTAFIKRTATEADADITIKRLNELTKLL
jgi:putative hydrolase of the HAD superfamily